MLLIIYLGHPLFYYFLDGQWKNLIRNGNIISEKFHFFHYFYILHSRGICHEETCSLFFLRGSPYNFPKCHILIRVCALCKILISEMVIVPFSISFHLVVVDFMRCARCTFFVISIYLIIQVLNWNTGKYKVYLANLFPT